MQPKADHVKVTLYYEALCGGCHQWISDEMYPTYQKLGKYMDIDFVPYGNADVRINFANFISFNLHQRYNLIPCRILDITSHYFYFSNNNLEIAGHLNANTVQMNVTGTSNNPACSIMSKIKILMSTSFIASKTLVISQMIIK